MNVCIHVPMCMYVCMYVCVTVCMYVYMYVCMYVCMYMYVCMPVNMCACIYYEYSCAQKLVNPPQNAHNYSLLNYCFIVEPCDKMYTFMMFSSSVMTEFQSKLSVYKL